jgi:hypothetical protein
MVPSPLISAFRSGWPDASRTTFAIVARRGEVCYCLFVQRYVLFFSVVVTQKDLTRSFVQDAFLFLHFPFCCRFAWAAALPYGKTDGTDENILCTFHSFLLEILVVQ